MQTTTEQDKNEKWREVGSQVHGESLWVQPNVLVTRSIRSFIFVNYSHLNRVFCHLQVKDFELKWTDRCTREHSAVSRGNKMLQDHHADRQNCLFRSQWAKWLGWHSSSAQSCCPEPPLYPLICGSRRGWLIRGFPLMSGLAALEAGVFTAICLLVEQCSPLNLLEDSVRLLK